MFYHNDFMTRCGRVVNYRSVKFLDEFYIATLPGVPSVNERPGLKAMNYGGAMITSTTVTQR